MTILMSLIKRARECRRSARKAQHEYERALYRGMAIAYMDAARYVRMFEVSP